MKTVIVLLMIGFLLFFHKYLLIEVL